MPGRKTTKQLSSELERYRNNLATPSKWQHVKSGGIYIALDVAYLERTMEKMVTYRSVDADVTFIRPYQEFLGKFRMVNKEKGDA